MENYYDNAGLLLLDAKNSRFTEENGFPVLFLATDEGEKRIGTVEVKRAFPFEEENGCLVVENGEGEDVGVILELSSRSKEEQSVLSAYLERRYYMPKILSILKANNRYGFSYFKVMTDAGEAEFSVRDPYKSILTMGKRLILTDADGNRYEIPDADALDKKSRKKIDSFLF